MRKFSSRHYIDGIVLILIVSAIVPSARADGIIVVDENPALFGNLNQNNTQCPLTGCGVTAAVNSFVFLQNEYPTVYEWMGWCQAPTRRGRPRGSRPLSPMS
jgi:hypothetical protein